jgi:hypothetical protein
VMEQIVGEVADPVAADAGVGDSHATIVSHGEVRSSYWILRCRGEVLGFFDGARRLAVAAV